MKNTRSYFYRAGTFAGALVLAVGMARADLAGTFTVPPYQLDSSVLGIEGWTSRLADAPTPDETARVRAVRWNQEAPALILRGASIKNVFPRTVGTRVQVTVRLALAFPLEGGHLHQMRIGFSGAPFGEIFFDAAVNGGLGYGGPGDGRTGNIALPHDQVKMNSFYTYSILVDYDTMTYDLSLKGQKRDGSPLDYEAKAVPFTVKTPFLDSLFIITGQTTITYIAELSAKSL